MKNSEKVQLFHAQAAQEQRDDYKREVIVFLAINELKDEIRGIKEMITSISQVLNNIQDFFPFIINHQT